MQSIDQKILFWKWEIKGKIDSPNCPYFPAKVVDCRLNYCILMENAKSMTSGRNR